MVFKNLPYKKDLLTPRGILSWPKYSYMSFFPDNAEIIKRKYFFITDTIYYFE